MKKLVSVPSRGILFPNEELYGMSEEKFLERFRPLSGHLISKYKHNL